MSTLRRRAVWAVLALLLCAATPQAKLYNPPLPFPLTGAVPFIVIPVQFSDLTWYPWTKAQIETWTAGVVSLYDSNSFGQFHLQPTVVDWATIPLTRNACDFYTIEEQANAAVPEAAGYPIKVYLFPSSSCGRSEGMNGRVWLSGQIEPMAHELGHVFGLFHSSGESCTNGVCSGQEYGDVYCVMGQGFTNYLSGYQRDKLGWVEGMILDAPRSGQYFIDHYWGPYRGIPKILRVPLVVKDYMTQWLYIDAGRGLQSNGLTFSRVEEWRQQFRPGVWSPYAAAGALLDLDAVTSTVKHILAVGESVVIQGTSYLLRSSDASGAVIEMQNATATGPFVP